MLALPLGAAAQDAPAPLAAQACAGCHGQSGAGAGAIPKIAGLPQDQFVSVMRAYQSDERKGTIMNRVARGFTDPEIKAMAHYFATRR
jgi:sulfide dehydrogenase cytochrome subunit